MHRQRRNDLHKLDVYRCALQLYRKVGQIVVQFPRGEGDLRGQMKRASRSVPFNIGEGVGKPPCTRRRSRSGVHINKVRHALQPTRLRSERTKN